MREVGKNIRRYRMELGMTPKRLAAMCELEVSTIQYIENGKLTPTLEMIEKIASALRQRPERLTGWKREGGPIISWWEQTEEGTVLHVEWEKPFRLASNESYPMDGAVRLVFEEMDA